MTGSFVYGPQSTYPFVPPTRAIHLPFPPSRSASPVFFPQPSPPPYYQLFSPSPQPLPVLPSQFFVPNENTPFSPGLVGGCYPGTAPPLPRMPPPLLVKVTGPAMSGRTAAAGTAAKARTTASPSLAVQAGAGPGRAAAETLACFAQTVPSSSRRASQTATSPAHTTTSYRPAETRMAMTQPVQETTRDSLESKRHHEGPARRLDESLRSQAEGMMDAVASSTRYRIQPGSLGKGSFSVVQRAIHVGTQQPVAIKVLDKAKMQRSAEEKERVRREVTILKRLRSPFVVQLYELIESASSIHLVMEYMQGGELFELINARGRLSEEEATGFMCDVLLGLAELHAAGVVWRDCKCENILIDGLTGRAKLADLGLGGYLIVGDSGVISSDLMNSSDTRRMGTSFGEASFIDVRQKTVSEFAEAWGSHALFSLSCGSPAYAAPEMVRAASLPITSPSYGFSVDVWSAGVVLYAMLHGRLPFEAPDGDTAVLYRKILAGTPDINPSLTSAAKYVLFALLTVEPCVRVTAADALALPWFEGERLKRRFRIVCRSLSDQSPPSGTDIAADDPVCAVFSGRSFEPSSRGVSEVEFMDETGESVTSRVSPFVKSALIGHPNLGCDWEHPDEEILTEMTEVMLFDRDQVQLNLKTNRHNALTTHYYLLVAKRRRELRHSVQFSLRPFTIHSPSPSPPPYVPPQARQAPATAAYGPKPQSEPVPPLVARSAPSRSRTPPPGSSLFFRPGAARPARTSPPMGAATAPVQTTAGVRLHHTQPLRSVAAPGRCAAVVEQTALTEKTVTGSRPGARAGQGLRISLGPWAPQAPPALRSSCPEPVRQLVTSRGASPALGASYPPRRSPNVPVESGVSVGSFVGGSVVMSENFRMSGRDLAGALRRASVALRLKLGIAQPGLGRGTTRIIFEDEAGNLKIEAEVVKGGAVRFKRLLGTLRVYAETVEKILEKVRNS